ncbi:Bug family tripartite tricarboxylate transporter substrate binding protein [Azohydromonas caseinilytica]|uniref:Tripartite tricarboxylate transporter substrate binding protein n=1 Tax=Azohydromonas caseinilytica TaxID=2728836 RepID=A0A848FC30_9BURK|nr:tripartite tricarboxylate transporter substrate-binding protein [Azohydromonas caseinilytica]NML15521.1 tripartite tricarboxylate transporter substrate binding protein [Azohydromonas caseinilytica]
MKQLPSRRSVLALSLAAAAFAVAGPAAAQARKYPDHPITFVVPFPAGSATDQLARVLAEHIGRAAGQSVIIDNKPGANGSIGTAAAAKAPADGHSFLVATSTTHAANASLYRKLPYDPIKDFTPVARLAEIPFVMLVNPSVPADTPQKFVAHVKANPDKLAWGSGSSGSLIPGHALVAANGLRMTHVPYKGVQPAMTDAIGGQTQLVFADTASAVPQVKAGKLRALAVTSAAPHPMLPGVPPMSVVVPGFEMTAWFAMYAPAATPAAVVSQMNQWVRAALADPAVQAKLAPSGFNFTPSSPQELGLFAAKETIKWAKAVQAAGIQPE